MKTFRKYSSKISNLLNNKITIIYSANISIKWKYFILIKKFN